MAIMFKSEIEEVMGWLETVVSAVEIHPVAKLGPTVEDTLTSIIVSQARNYGPSLVTGGHLHAVTKEQAVAVAQAIALYAPIHNVDPYLILAGLEGESRCDPYALNPNFQDGKPGETVTQRWMHTDVGAGQFDGSTLSQQDGIFSDLKGLSIDEMEAKAFDTSWAVDHFCAFVAKLFVDTKAEVERDPTLLDNVPNHDIRILTVEAYNAGETGAKLIEQHNGDWSYGKGWIDRYESNLALQKVT